VLFSARCIHVPLVGNRVSIDLAIELSGLGFGASPVPWDGHGVHKTEAWGWYVAAEAVFRKMIYIYMKCNRTHVCN
jgi:hypothetical protein